MRRVPVAHAIAGIIACALSLHARANNWPVIQPAHQTHTFTDAAGEGDAPFLAFIKNVAGVPVYKLECHNGNYNDRSGYNFSGTFQCALFGIRGYKPTTWNLLAANTRNEQSTDWWNRGRILSPQLWDKCLAYPEYSTLRHFRLRRMLITFRFSNLGWRPAEDGQGYPLLTKFTFTLDVVPDKAAQSSRAEPPTGPKPPTSCYP
jgi:hypothetical protein